MSKPAIAFVVAISRNGVIGAKGGLPWRLPSDLKRFKAMTMGKPVIMGRKTWDSVGRPLPGRLNIVISSNPDLRLEGAETATSLEKALEIARARIGDADEICILGGGTIYAEALPIADHLHVTHVLADIEGDTYFPHIDALKWEPVFREEIPQGERDTAPMLFVTYERRAA